MTDALAVKSNIVDHKNDISDGQAAKAFGERIRVRADELGKGMTDLGKAAGIKKQSMAGYWNGDRLCGSDKLFALADALRVRARWLISGNGPKVLENPLREAGDAEVIDLPRFNLRELTDDSKGEPAEIVPFRRDWLYRKLGRTNGLWLTELPSSNYALALAEGDLVICSDIDHDGRPYEGQVCIWRSEAGPVIGQFSVLGRETGLAGAVTPSDIIRNELHAVARIHLRLLAGFDEATSMRYAR